MYKILPSCEHIRFAEHIIGQQRTSIRSKRSPTHFPAAVTMFSILSTANMEKLHALTQITSPLV